MKIAQHSSASSSPDAEPEHTYAADPEPPPGRRFSGPRLHNLRADASASLVVFLIAIPLSLGIAMAAGAPLTAGLISAAVGGLVVGLLSGSPLQVSGPAAGLTVVMAGLIHTFGWAATCAITVAAGFLQILLGLSRVSRAALALSPAVVHGMLAAIGIVIALSQLHVVLGGSAQSSAVDNLAQLPDQLAANHPPAIAVGLATVLLLFAWPKLAERGLVGPLKHLPAPLVAIALVTAGSAALGLNVARVNLPSIDFAPPALPAGHSWTLVAGAVVTVAVVSGVETLLAAVAVDRLHTGPRAHLDRELAAQGVGNIIAGLLGGFPVAGAGIRSAANIRAGAATRASTVLHGAWMVLLAGLLGGLVERIPLAALAALVMVVGLRMVNRLHIRGVHRHREFFSYLATVLGVVLLGVLEGVALGLLVSGVTALLRLSRATVMTETRDGAVHVNVHGSLTFLSVPRLTRVLAELPPGQRVVLDLTVDYIDQGAFEAVHAWRNSYTARGGTVTVEEVHSDGYRRAEAGTPGPDRAPLTPSPRWFAPWWHWQEFTAHHPLVAGTREFQQRTAPLVQPFLERLALEGQKPAQLFITCADSRLVPNLITASGPGDLFTVRNVGNLVPRQDIAYDGDKVTIHADHSVGAAIEYAVGILGVRSITVCGHSGCGAMQAMLDKVAHGPSGENGHSSTPDLDRWLRNGQHTMDRFIASEPPTLCGEQMPPAEALCLTNVLQQLDNLRAHPVVRTAVDEGRLRLFGLYFDIASAQMYMYDGTAETFSPVYGHATLAEVPVRELTAARKSLEH